MSKQSEIELKEILRGFAKDQEFYGNGEFGYTLYDATHAIQALIDTACVEARIDELEDFPIDSIAIHKGEWVDIPTYIKNRIKQLKATNQEKSIDNGIDL